MMNSPQWPGIAGPFVPQRYGFPDEAPPARSATAAPAADGVATPWWSPIGNALSQGGANNAGTVFGVLQLILAVLQQVVGTFAAGAQSGGTTAPSPFHAAEQAGDVDISSTGDPHLAQTGTIRTPAGTQNVDQHFDSMASHDDLVETNAVAGGYRVSTAVTQPDANGVTYNRAATVHAGGGFDCVTMRNDGSVAIVSGGEQVGIEKGASVTLGGGETVTENQDGSLVVSAANDSGGTISTTLRANGAGVDVTTHAHQLGIGGDVVEQGRPHHGGHHRRPAQA